MEGLEDILQGYVCSKDLRVRLTESNLLQRARAFEFFSQDAGEFFGIDLF